MIIKIITAIIANMLANLPASIESFPKPGPTVLSSNIFKGTGKAPALNTKARSFASWTVKFPVI
jgi:hypothetical protein